MDFILFFDSYFFFEVVNKIIIVFFPSNKKSCYCVIFLIFLSRHFSEVKAIFLALTHYFLFHD